VKQQCESKLPGTEETAVETGPGKGKAAMLEPDRRGTGVAVMSQSCSLVDQSRKAERSQEVRRGPQGKRFSQGRRNGNPNRELVKRKQSSDCGRRIRKRVRQLTRASKGRHGALACRANPTEVWNKVARRRKARGRGVDRKENSSPGAGTELLLMHFCLSLNTHYLSRELVKRKPPSGGGRLIRK
jgi:hypothetical protein